jgi:hypothetical protein
MPGLLMSLSREAMNESDPVLLVPVQVLLQTGLSGRVTTGFPLSSGSTGEPFAHVDLTTSFCPLVTGVRATHARQ